MNKQTNPGKRKLVPCTQLNVSDNSGEVSTYNPPWAMRPSPFIGVGANGTLTDTPAPATALRAYPYSKKHNFLMRKQCDHYFPRLININYEANIICK